MMADANLEKWSSALSLLSTVSVPTASLLCSKMYQSSKAFLFYSQGATNTYCVSQQTPAMEIRSHKAVCPVAQTLPLFSEDLGWHRKAPCPHLQASVRFLMLPYSEKMKTIGETYSRNIFGYYDQKGSISQDTTVAGVRSASLNTVSYIPFL